MRLTMVDNLISFSVLDGFSYSKKSGLRVGGIELTFGTLYLISSICINNLIYSIFSVFLESRCDSATIRQRHAKHDFHRLLKSISFENFSFPSLIVDQWSLHTYDAPFLCHHTHISSTHPSLLLLLLLQVQTHSTRTKRLLSTRSWMELQSGEKQFQFASSSPATTWLPLWETSTRSSPLDITWI